MTLSKITLSKMTLSKMTLSKMTLSKMTLSIKDRQQNDILHNDCKKKDARHTDSHSITIFIIMTLSITILSIVVKRLQSVYHKCYPEIRKFMVMSTLVKFFILLNLLEQCSDYLPVGFASQGVNKDPSVWLDEARPPP